MNYEKVIFCGDFHAPYEDPACLSAFLSFCKEFKPHKIFLNGDIIDFYAISRFVRDPERSLKLQDELDDAVSILTQIRKVNPKTEITYIKDGEYGLIFMASSVTFIPLGAYLLAIK